MQFVAFGIGMLIAGLFAAVVEALTTPRKTADEWNFRHRESNWN